MKITSTSVLALIVGVSAIPNFAIRKDEYRAQRRRDVNVDSTCLTMDQYAKRDPRDLEGRALCAPITFLPTSAASSSSIASTSASLVINTIASNSVSASMAASVTVTSNASVVSSAPASVNSNTTTKKGYRCSCKTPGAILLSSVPGALATSTGGSNPINSLTIAPPSMTTFVTDGRTTTSTLPQITSTKGCTDTACGVQGIHPTVNYTGAVPTQAVGKTPSPSGTGSSNAQDHPNSAIALSNLNMAILTSGLLALTTLVTLL